MKIKNIKFSLLILGSLVILSFAFLSYAQEKSATGNNVFLDSDQDGLSDTEEKTYGTDARNSDTDGDSYTDGAEVKAGYDPLKPAPGDKITTEESKNYANNAASENGNNLTNDVVGRITALTDNAGGDPQVTQENLQSIIEETLNSQISEEDLPKINPDEMKIKKQDYSKLSAEKRAAKEKEDFAKYITSVGYVLSSNSPKPITSDSDMSRLANSFTQQTITALTTGDSAALNDVSQSAEKSLDQMKDVEVPESLIDLHTKGLTFVKYASSFKDKLYASPDDPMSDLVKFSKLKSFAEVVADFSTEVQSTFDQYGVDMKTPLGQIGAAASDSSKSSGGNN